MKYLNMSAVQLEDEYRRRAFSGRVSEGMDPGTYILEALKVQRELAWDITVEMLELNEARHAILLEQVRLAAGSDVPHLPSRRRWLRWWLPG